MKTINYSILITLFAFLFSCSSEKTEGTNEDENAKNSTKTAIVIEENNEPAFENLNVQYAKHEYSANEENVFTAESGSEISIPKDAFVDENGKLVEGNVEIKYREILSPSEIILSGVDMKYEKDGKVYDFQTAGMFDIRAFSQGNEVFLQKDKEVSVNFASNIEGDYDFYYYNEEKQNWVDTDYGKIEMTTDNKTDAPSTSFKMLKPVKLDPSKDLVIDVKADYKKFPALIKYKGMVWKYTGDKSMDEVKALLSKRWSGSELKELDSKKNKYTLKMITGRKAYELVVSPVFSGRNYKKALSAYQLEKKKHELTQQYTKSVKRKVNVSQMGLHNYDIIHSSDRMIVQSDFNVQKNEQLLPVQNMNFFLITGNNVVVRYNHVKKTSLYFSPSSKSKIVAVMPGNKVAVLSTTDFKIFADQCRSKGIKDYTFKLTEIDRKINSANDLDEIIASL